MSFIDSYKRLEKLCNEMYGDNHGLSTYIDEMIDKPNGSHYVSNWNEDLKQLKHYRWIRNQIVHEPGCTEENMCESGDMQWIDNFYSRIMSTNDPLTLYRKVRSSQRVQKPKQTYSSHTTNYTYQQYGNISSESKYENTSSESKYRKTSSKLTDNLTYLIGILFILGAVVLFISIYCQIY